MVFIQLSLCYYLVNQCPYANICIGLNFKNTMLCQKMDEKAQIFILGKWDSQQLTIEKVKLSEMRIKINLMFMLSISQFCVLSLVLSFSKMRSCVFLKGRLIPLQYFERDDRLFLLTWPITFFILPMSIGGLVLRTIRQNKREK